MTSSVPRIDNSYRDGGSGFLHHQDIFNLDIISGCRRDFAAIPAPTAASLSTEVMRFLLAPIAAPTWHQPRLVMRRLCSLMASLMPVAAPVPWRQSTQGLPEVAIAHIALGCNHIRRSITQQGPLSDLLATNREPSLVDELTNYLTSG